MSHSPVNKKTNLSDSIHETRLFNWGLLNRGGIKEDYRKNVDSRRNKKRNKNKSENEKSE